MSGEGGVAEVEALAVVVFDQMAEACDNGETWQDLPEEFREEYRETARAVLASDWLAAHDAQVRAEALAPIEALAEEWDARLRREFVLSDNDPKWTDWHSRELRAAMEAKG